MMPDNTAHVAPALGHEVPAALINDPVALLAFFTGFVAVVFWLARARPLAKVFRYVPPIVWIYLLPAAWTTLRVTPAKSMLYDWCADNLLPFALMLLIVSTDLKALARLGPMAATMMLAGTFGIVVGGPLALALFQPSLDPQMWKGLAALAGSWIGGNSNMFAIKESVHCPGDIMAPVIVIDSVVGYGWMSIMISMVWFQDGFDRWNRARRQVIDELSARLSDYQAQRQRPITLPSLAIMLGVGMVGGWLCMRLGDDLPEYGAVVSHYTWGIMLVLVVGVALALTPVRRLEDEGASTVAYGVLYLLVATMGAGGDLRAVLEAPTLLLLGILWVLIHAACLLAAARILRAPAFLFVTGSQGNIGGVISTPVVAGVYQPALAPMGVLMGVLGNLVGTPAGLLCAQLMAWVAVAYYGDAALHAP